jgi:ProP effector
MVDTPQKPKQQKMAQAREDLEILIKAFPKCFTLQDPRPLKVGIKEDIFEKWGSEAPMNKTRFGHVVKGYTCTKRYLKSFEKETYRYGMNGEQAQEIAEEARTHAKELLATIYKEGKK